MGSLADRMGRKWRTFWALSGSERWLLLQALLLLPAVVVTLRTAGFRRTYSVLTRLPSNGKPRPELESRTAARTVARLVDAAARNCPLSSSCLARSLTLWRLLARQGIGADLRLGVRQEGDRIAAHAWVEYQGAVLNDDAGVHQRFAAFDPLVAESR
jgi:hypothetical protein